MPDTLWVVVMIGAAVGIAWLLRVSRGSKDRNTADFGRATTFGPSEIEAYVRGHIVELAEEQFPDNKGLQWTVHKFQHREDVELTFAEVEPHPDEVGYPRFQFAFLTASGGPPKQVATYCLQSGKYTLLSTSRGAPTNLPKEL